MHRPFAPTYLCTPEMLLPASTGHREVHLAKLLRILLGMRTLFEGTDSPIALSVNDVQINFSDTAQADQEMGQANLYDSDVTRFNIDTAELNNSSIRVVILGDDQWKPVIVVAWAELPHNVILPLASIAHVDVELVNGSAR